MNRKRGYLYILLAAMIFSTTEVALKGLGGVFAPMQITVERVLIGALFLLPFALRSLRRNAIRLTRSDWSYFALLGFLTVTLHMSLLQMAVFIFYDSATSLIYSGNPVFALAAAHLILHEPLKRNHLIAIGVELIGILFILNPAKLEVSPRGFAEILTATILFAMYGTLCKLRIPRLGGLVITTFNMVLGGLELLALLLLGHIPAVGALYRSLGLDIFADVPFFTGFTLRSALLLCYVGVFCAAIGFLLTAKITEYTSATEASFVYLIKPVLATLLAVVCFHEAISVNRMIGLVFFLAASYPTLCAAAKRRLSPRAQQRLRFWRDGVTHSLTRWLRAQAILCSLTFCQLLAGFWLLGERYSLLAAFLITLVDALPVFGTGTVLIPWALAELLLGSVPRGAALVILYLCTLTVRSITEPKLVAAQAGLPPIASLMAMYLGARAFGVAGMVLFPLLLLLAAQMLRTKKEGSM